ncbi:MAG: MBL fold metallo-hydrolase [Bacteroidales bacterium]
MRITDRIHQLLLPFSLRISGDIIVERSVNIFILLGRYITLIDAGPAGSEKKIFAYLKELGRSPDEIKYLLLTHSHPDHMGAAAAIREVTGCRVGIHPYEQRWIEDIEYQFQQRPVPDFHHLVQQPVKADLLLNDEDILDTDDNLRIKVIHTPGHSPGSVCYLLQQDNALFTGDAIPVKHVTPIFDSWHESLSSMEKLENLPYARYLLSAWHDYRQQDEVQDFISDGIEWLYEIYTAIEKFRPLSNLPVNDLAEMVLKELHIARENYHPLYERTIQRMHIDTLHRG